ncbi:MAG: hypothetical protein ABI197_11245 [Granulicella sp.]
MPTNDHTPDNQLYGAESDKLHGRSAEQPGYETTDVNVNGVVVFLAGLSGFVLIFFVFCFGMGRAINNALEKNDGPVNKWNELSSFAGAATTGGKRQDLASDPEIRQKALEQLTTSFPAPRVDTDDGEQAIADMHAREDLLLDHYSSSAKQPGTIRIPVDEAMRLIVQRGLPVAPQPVMAAQLADDAQPAIEAPLTTGFARTGYELDVMEARAQRVNYGKAAESAHAEPKANK